MIESSNEWRNEYFWRQLQLCSGVSLPQILIWMWSFDYNYHVILVVKWPHSYQYLRETTLHNCSCLQKYSSLHSLELSITYTTQEHSISFKEQNNLHVLQLHKYSHEVERTSYLILIMTLNWQWNYIVFRVESHKSSPPAAKHHNMKCFAVSIIVVLISVLADFIHSYPRAATLSAKSIRAGELFSSRSRTDGKKNVHPLE